MAVKNVGLPYQTINSVSISGTTQVTSSVSNIMYHDSVAISSVWSGNPQGTVDLQGSVDYNQGFPQTGGGLRIGNWTSLTLSPAPAVSGSSTILINLNQLSFAWLRIVYTNSTGSGVLSSWICSKSLG